MRRYSEAAALYERGYLQAVRDQQPAIAARFLSNAGACRLSLLEYRGALEAFLRARELAAGEQECQAAVAASMNLSSVHFSLGELDGAAVEARRGAAILTRCPAATARAAPMLQLAKTEAQVQGLVVAAPIYLRALAAADGENNPRLAGQIWNAYGWDLTAARRFADAEEALANGFRLRVLNGRVDLESSYLTLAALRLAQGDAVAAERLATAATAENSARPGRVPNWHAFYRRGEARLAQGQPRPALADLREAIRIARRWRLAVVPADANRIGADSTLDELYTAFVYTAGELYARTGDAALAREAFEIAEENRAASLRAIALHGGRPAQLPPRYAEALAGLRSMETRLLAGWSAAADAEARRLRHELNLMEAAAGLGEAAPEPALRTAGLETALRGALEPGEVFLAVAIGPRGSLLWAVTQSGFELHRLPPRRELQAVVHAFAAAVRSGTRGGGRALYEVLFAPLSASVKAKQSWILALDEDLFEAPLGAAVAADGSAVLDRHTLRSVPSAHFLLRRPPLKIPDGLFLGIGDPIYNRADERLGRTAAAGAAELPRLAASGAEVRACARAWSRGPALLLEGSGASAGSVWPALAKGPVLVHFASHFVAPLKRPDQVHIALSLSARGEPDLLTASEISARECGAAVVVLNGCGSGRGPIAPGAGLLGLTRAWLAAGAGTVVATLWPVPDSSGAMLAEFYRRLARGESAAESLRNAQLQSKEQGASSRDWAAYVIVGKG